MIRKSLTIVLFAILWNFTEVRAQPTHAVSRGELLYSMHCVACHTTQVHWRDKKLATDWGHLQSEVARWQKLSELGWNNDDVTAVARYLNAIHYHYPTPD